MRPLDGASREVVTDYQKRLSAVTRQQSKAKPQVDHSSSNNVGILHLDHKSADKVAIGVLLELTD